MATVRYGGEMLPSFSLGDRGRNTPYLEWIAGGGFQNLKGLKPTLIRSTD